MSVATFPTLVMPPPVAPQPKRWEVGEFHRVRELPWLENRRLILVEGVIVEMPSANPPHDAALLLTTEVLRNAFGSGHCIRGQMGLVLNQSTDPVPDLAVVPGSPRDYSEHPHSALLVVEVAESSLPYDTREKAGLYAAAGIQDYWVVDLIHRQLIVHRDPHADPAKPFQAAFLSITAWSAGQSVSPLAASGASVRVQDLLP